MNTGGFDQAAALRAAKIPWGSDNTAEEATRHDRGKALAALEVERERQARRQAIISEFENDLESESGRDELENAPVKLKSSEFLLRWAEAQAKKMAEQWQEAERKRRRNAQQARAEALTAFDRLVDEERGKLASKWQALTGGAADVRLQGYGASCTLTI